MNAKIAVIVFLLSVTAVIIYPSCNSDEAADMQLAKQYCGSCHLFPEPSLLDKATWQKNIFPAMGPKLGIRYFLDSPYVASDYEAIAAKGTAIPNSTITLGDWRKIMDYYQRNAPDTALGQNRPPVKEYTDLFVTKEVFSSQQSALTTYLKIDEGNRWIYMGNAADSSLDIFDDKLQLLSKYDLHGIMVDMQFNGASQHAGERKGILTNIGILNPNDLKTGTASSFNISKDAVVSPLQEVLSQMPRPVQTSEADLDNDGLQDYLVAGFGNTNGALYWMKNLGNGQYQQNAIRALPGTIKTYTGDYNHDGLTDIIALMAQAEEGIYLFTNKGNGNFDSKALLTFPPVYGSSYFEFDDFNNDGYKDILYTCGDNADYSSRTLKNYHGVYIFLNDGKDNFIQKYFFPIHGCYKAMARDFDKDGDLDIATISFFPDKKHQPQEAFVYLENKGLSYFSKSFQFEPYSINTFDKGNWLTMDAGDVDGDGDDDIVLGSFDAPGKELQVAHKELLRPSFIVLLNKTNSKAGQ